MSDEDTSSLQTDAGNCARAHNHTHTDMDMHMHAHHAHLQKKSYAGQQLQKSAV